MTGASTVWASRAARGSAGIVAAGAAALSFRATSQVAESSGAVGTGWGWIVPLTVEAGVLTAAALAWVRSGEGLPARTETIVMSALLALSVVVNVAHASHGTDLGRVIAAVPPVVLLVAVEGLLREQRRTALIIPSVQLDPIPPGRRLDDDEEPQATDAPPEVQGESATPESTPVQHSSSPDRRTVPAFATATEPAHTDASASEAAPAPQIVQPLALVPARPKRQRSDDVADQAVAVVVAATVSTVTPETPLLPVAPAEPVASAPVAHRPSRIELPVQAAPRPSVPAPPPAAVVPPPARPLAIVRSDDQGGGEQDVVRRIRRALRGGDPVTGPIVAEWLGVSVSTGGRRLRKAASDHADIAAALNLPAPANQPAQEGRPDDRLPRRRQPD